MLKNKFVLYSFFAILGLSIFSCTKDPDLIGLDLLPASDHLAIGYTDTSSVTAYTIREDSLRTDELTLNLLGSIADPVFGTTTASIYTQFRTASSNITFGENPVADSLVLSLTYAGYYGDTLAPKTIRVYEMADSISYDSSYYSNRSIAVLPQLIGTATFVPNLSVADSVDDTYIPPHMRIMLSQEFANKILTADTTTLSDNVYFQQLFKGLYITSDEATTPGTGSILYFNLLDGLSRLKLYYHNSTDTTSVTFPMGSTVARFNHYDHNYSTASSSLQGQLGGDTTLGQQQLFIQSMAGTKVKLRIPYLKALASQKKLALNEAILIVQVQDTGSIYTEPATISLKQLTSDGKYETLADEVEGSSFIDGTSQSGIEYRFRITRYVQERLSNPDEEDYGLMLYAAGSSLTGNRVVLKGGGAENGKIKLALYYTSLD